MKKTMLIILLAMVGLLFVACQGDDDERPSAEQLPATVPPPVVEAPPTHIPVSVDPNGLLRQPWQWVSYNGAVESFEIQSPQNYHLAFNQNGTLSVIADCNNVSGAYGADETGRIVVELGASTKALCPPGSRGEQFTNLLGSAARYGFDGANLNIELVADGGTMRFTPAQPVAVQPTLPPPTATPIPPPPTATPETAVNLPSMPGSVTDRGPRDHAQGTYAAPYYTVVRGDTVYGISQRFGVPVALILAANELDANGLIIPGQRLVIGAVPTDGGGAVNLPSLPGTVMDRGPSQYASGTYQAPYYTVARGDTLYSIAARFGLAIPQIMAANALDNPEEIFADQKLVIPGQAAITDFERVTFPGGGISATLHGVINQGQPKHYVLGAGAGQTIEINTSSAGVPLGVSLQAPSGSLLTLTGENQQVNNVLYYVRLPENGDYTVTVTPATLPEGPQMNFQITFVIQ